MIYRLIISFIMIWLIDDIIFQNQGELILEECDKMSMFVQSYIRDLLMYHMLCFFKYWISILPYSDKSQHLQVFLEQHLSVLRWTKFRYSIS